VVPLLLITVIGQVDKIGISVVMSNKKFLQDLNLVGRPAVVGLLMTGFLLSYSFFQFFWGYFVKRFGPRISAIVGIIIWGGTMALSGAAHSANALITARIILGIGEAFTFPVSNTFVANWFPVKERGRANSIWLNGLTLGPVVCGALVVAVIGAGGWRMVFYVLAALSILIPLPLVIFLMRDKPRQHKRLSAEELKLIEEGSLAKTKEVPHAAALEGKSSYLSNYRFWLVTLAWGFNNIFFWGWSTWMPTYFQNARHFSFQAAGYLYSLTFFFQLATVLIVGYYSDRTMRRAPFGAAGWIIAGILMFIGGTVIGNAYWALAVLITAVCCQQPAFMMSQTLLQSIIPEGSMGAASGVAGGVSMLMSVVSPWLIGFFLQISGFGAVILFLSLASLVPGIMTSFLVKEGY
jgi:sugar phosphate permease